MTEDANLNPYEPPDETLPSETSSARGKGVGIRDRREIDRMLLFVLPIGFAFWIFVVGAAVYELVSMPSGAYGPNRPLFRRSYYWTLSKGGVMSVFCLSAYFAVYRGYPYSRSIGTAAVAVSILFLAFLL